LSHLRNHLAKRVLLQDYYDASVREDAKNHPRDHTHHRSNTILLERASALDELGIAMPMALYLRNFALEVVNLSTAIS
jgi:hypothetical protein